MIEHRKKSGNKDDCGEHLKGEGEAERRNLLADFSKHEFRSNVGKAQQPVYGVTRGLKDLTANIEAQDKESKRKLQPKSPKNSFQANGLALCGEQIRQAKHGAQAEYSHESSHSFSF